MMMHKALHPRDETDYMCEERKEKEDTSIEDNVDSSIPGLDDYKNKSLRKTNYSDQKQHVVCGVLLKCKQHK